MTNKSQHFIRRLIAREVHKHPLAIILFTLLALSAATLFIIVLSGTYSGGSGDAHVVQLSVEGERQTVPTRATSVGDFLKRVDIKLQDGDVVEPSTDTYIDSDDFRINVYRAKPVTIIDGQKRIQAFSAASTPRSIAAQAGVQVHPEDNIDYANAQEAIEDQVLGTELIIDRATPVRLLLYGTPITVRTHAVNVRDLLGEKNIVLASSDEINRPLETVLESDMELQINRKGTKIVTESEKIENEVQYVDDDSLSFGTIAVRQSGSPGKKVVTYQLELKNGKEVSRKRIQEVIAQKPVPKIVARGKAISIPEDKSELMAAAGIAEGDYPYANHIISHESGWCPTKWQGQIGYCPPYYEPIHPIDSGYGYGLCQATPGSKMASAGDDWQTNAVTQLEWCSGYAEGRYGSWSAAYEFWQSKHWW